MCIRDSVYEPAEVPLSLYPVPPNTDRTIATSFDVWIEDSYSDPHTWPGKCAGTALIGRVPLAEHRGIACVVADRVRPAMDLLPPLVMAADEVAALRDVGVSSFPSVAVARDQDGTILLIERWSRISDE